jgi:DNA polymerase I-like protein with 3'-5' exonuclease and polymerase domains
MSTDWIRVPQADLDRSPALAAMYTKLTKERKIPAVNLLALARRDETFMRVWQPDPGRIFVSCDFSSLEPSITAHFSGDPYYRYATFDGIGKLPHFDHNDVLMIDDIYLMTASVMPGVGVTICAFFRDMDNCKLWLSNREAITGHKIIKPIRAKAKTACLGFGYSMGAPKFARQAYEAGMLVTLSEARGMHKAYWDLFREVKVFSKKLSALVNKNGSIVNPMGYRLTPEPHKAFNAYIQSTASGVLDLFCLDFFDRCKDARLIANIHDESVFDIPNTQESIADCRKAHMESVQQVNDILQWTISMRMSFQLASSFAEMK